MFKVGDLVLFCSDEPSGIVNCFGIVIEMRLNSQACKIKWLDKAGQKLDSSVIANIHLTKALNHEQI